MSADDVKRLRLLEQENTRLKKILAERDLEIEVMKEIAAKNGRRTRPTPPGGIRQESRTFTTQGVCAVIHFPVVASLRVTAGGPGHAAAGGSGRSGCDVSALWIPPGSTCSWNVWVMSWVPTRRSVCGPRPGWKCPGSGLGNEWRRPVRDRNCRWEQTNGGRTTMSTTPAQTVNRSNA